MVLGEHEEDENEITAVLGRKAKTQAVRRLILSTGPHAGEQFELSGETITLGRARDNEIPLSLDKEVSRRHAVMKLEGDQYVIQDQNSLNGTYVNNERLSGPKPLADGDVIFIGVSDIIYQVE
jgi:pSer/pThr/pTyr-binding forkhead associated (FHA) protein